MAVKQKPSTSIITKINFGKKTNGKATKCPNKHARKVKKYKGQGK